MQDIEANTLPPPQHNDHGISPWIDEQIWGHRLYDQSDWMLFLEFLTVAEARHRDGRLLDALNEHGEYYPLLFKPRKRMYLRNILFNNEEIFRISDQASDSSTAWDSWLNSMSEKAQGVHTRDFSYLRTRFHSFSQFASLVAILRGSNVEAGGNKRWTSRFVFPFGPNAIYEDLIISPSGTASRDYINFGRTGELLYLMLARCSSSTALQEHLASIFERQNDWDELLGLMQPESPDDDQLRGKSYLPYKSHWTFDSLGRDWLSIFELSLPGFDSFPHLVALAAFHVLLYQLHISAELLEEVRPSFICEVVAPKKTLVRELSFSSYLTNNLLPSRAIDSYISAVELSEPWRTALAEPDPFVRCRQILEEKFRWGSAAGDYNGPSDPHQLLQSLREAAAKRHKQHTANIHRGFGRDIGLVSRRGTNRLRYAPTDLFLKTLVLTTVPDRMELSEFLKTLFDRYGLIFGDVEAEQILASDEFDKKVFQSNTQRLEQRLGTLGFLRRLSDDCAYVENSFAKKEENQSE